MKIRELKKILRDFPDDGEVFFELDTCGISKETFTFLQAETVYKHPARNKRNAIVIGQRATHCPLWKP